jgi:hypothetical protein
VNAALKRAVVAAVGHFAFAKARVLVTLAVVAAVVWAHFHTAIIPPEASLAKARALFAVAVAEAVAWTVGDTTVVSTPAHLAQTHTILARAVHTILGAHVRPAIIAPKSSRALTSAIDAISVAGADNSYLRGRAVSKRAVVARETRGTEAFALEAKTMPRAIVRAELIGAVLSAEPRVTRTGAIF